MIYQYKLIKHLVTVARRFPGSLRIRFSSACFLLLASLLGGGCDRHEDELAALKAENERLRKALQELQPATEQKSPNALDKPALDLTVNELWTQRFDDNQFRAKQRLDGKTIRVTGPVENLSGSNFSLVGESNRFGAVNISVHLDEAYFKRVFTSMGALNKGTIVTVQGLFVFEKMWVEGAQLVDRKSGRPLSADELAALEAVPPISPPTSENSSKPPAP